MLPAIQTYLLSLLCLLQFRNGNTRAVTDEYGSVMQRTDCYPFGMVIADRGFGAGMQPYKTAGKETHMMRGLATVEGVTTVVFQHAYDKIAGAEPMPGAISRKTHTELKYKNNTIGEHKITSFKDDLDKIFNILRKEKKKK